MSGKEHKKPQGERIGIMGGTFDPIHHGHLACAESVKDALDLDRVIFMVAGQPSFKQDRTLASAQDRLRMAQLGCSTNGAFQVSDIEVCREGTTYTIDTLQQLRREWGKEVELFFIMGADSFLSLDRWYRHEELGQHAQFVAANRPGHPLDPDQAALIAAHCSGRVHLVQIPSLDISSSEIRARAAKRQSIRYLVPDKVNDYIKENKLYAQA